jgi:hypothetical protein
MLDFLSTQYRAFAADSKGKIAWLDCAGLEVASAQVFAVGTWAGSPVFEPVVANDQCAPILLATVLGVTASTLEISTSTGITPSIDMGGMAVRWLGLRVKTAGNTGDRASIFLAGKAEGTGQITETIADTTSGAVGA